MCAGPCSSEWIEQEPPKFKVARSNRARGTIVGKRLPVGQRFAIRPLSEFPVASRGRLDLATGSLGPGPCPGSRARPAPALPG